MYSYLVANIFIYYGVLRTVRDIALAVFPTRYYLSIWNPFRYVEPIRRDLGKSKTRQPTRGAGSAARTQAPWPTVWVSTSAMISEVSARTHQHRITCSVCAYQHRLAAYLQGHCLKYSMARVRLKRYGLGSGIVVLAYTSYFNPPPSLPHIKTRYNRYYDCQLSGATMA